MRNPAIRERYTTVPGLYHVHHGDVFLPGAGNIVFEPKWQLPILQLIGHAIIAGANINPLQSPQVYAHQSAVVSGLGGPIAGQIITQPLNVPITEGS